MRAPCPRPVGMKPEVRIRRTDLQSAFVADVSPKATCLRGVGMAPGSCFLAGPYFFGRRLEVWRWGR
jgi:hypothetical protein